MEHHADDLHPTSGYSKEEEIANSVTHAIGTALSVVALTLAVVYSSMKGDPYLIVASAVYGVSMVALHASSALYHAARDLTWKRRFLFLDHACIYVFIAGSYTPFVLGPLRGPLGWGVFGAVWLAALVGVFRELSSTQEGGWTTALVYVCMGWICVVCLKPLYHELTGTGFAFLMTGAVLYTVGIVFYLWRGFKYHHAVWHLFVTGGAVCQFFAVLTLMQ